MTTLTEQLDTLYTTTWANRREGVADNVFDSTPFWYWMKEKGALKTEEGGRRIEESLRYGKSPNIGWIGKGATVGMGDMDHLTIAYYDWRYLADSIVRFMADDQQNRGKPQIIKLMNSKIDTSQDSLVEEMETRLCGKSTDAAAPGEYTPMHGLQEAVPDDPTANNNYGSIDNAARTWWRSQTKNLTGASFATNGFRAMQKMKNDCMNNLGMDKPEIIVSAQTPYEYYDEDVTEQRRIVNKTLGDMGFENVEFKGMPMIWTPYMSQRMYFLNTKFLSFVYDPMFYFDMTEWKAIPNQVQDRAAQILTACNLIMNRRRCHGVIYNIDTE